MTFQVGLTGGIGCGKSTVSALFAELGASVIDSDAISHQLTQQDGAAIALIRSTFGDDYINANGALDRPRMRQLVFSNAAAKLRLESILHPMIQKQMLSQASTHTASPYLLLVIPLLFETPSYQSLVQRTIVVDCAESTQLARAKLRSGLDEKTIRAIMSSQITRAERLQRADDIIHNDSDLNSLRNQVQQLHQRFLAISTGSD